MTDENKAKSTLDRVLSVLGMQAPVEETPVVELSTESSEVELAEPGLPDVPMAPVAEAPAVEEVKASVEEMIAALDAKVSAIADAIAKMVAEEVAEAPEVVEEAPIVPIPTAMSTNKLSAQPKFTGAPVEAPKNENAVKLKVDGTMSTVLSRLYGN